MSGPTSEASARQGEIREPMNVGDGEPARWSPTHVADALWVAMREAESADRGSGGEGVCARGQMHTGVQ